MLQWWHRQHSGPGGCAMATGMTELREWIAGIADLRRACAVLQWDQNTLMPPLGAPLRTEQLATLERIAHERLTSERTGELVGAAEAELERPRAGLGRGADRVGDAAAIREGSARPGRARGGPREGRVRVAMSGGWRRARRTTSACSRRRSSSTSNSRATTSPASTATTILTTSCSTTSRPGMRTAHAAALLKEMRDELMPLIDALRGREIDAAPLHVDLSGRRAASAR